MDNYCYRCGNKLPPGVYFCKSCGSKVNLRLREEGNLFNSEDSTKQEKNKKNINNKTDNTPKNDEELNQKALTIVSKMMANLVICPIGSFMMGSKAPKNPRYSLKDGELGRYIDEVQHKVIFTKTFRISKFLVTQVQYAAVMGKNPSYFKGIFRPVESISWYDAKEFCKRLNEKYFKFLPDGYRFDLPTEAQWEYACRAGTTTSLNSNKNLTTETGSCSNLDELGWYNKNSNGKTHFVGKKKPNSWGLYDMHGNVWEWCRDWYGDYIVDDMRDPLGPVDGTYKILRGGSWHFKAIGCRSALRNRNFPHRKSNRIGFRIAVVPIKF